MLPLNLSGSAATSQDGSSLEIIAAIVGRQCYIQDATGKCQLSCVPCHVTFKYIFFFSSFYKVVELVGGGYFFNGACALKVA